MLQLLFRVCSVDSGHVLLLSGLKLSLILLSLASLLWFWLGDFWLDLFCFVPLIPEPFSPLLSTLTQVLRWKGAILTQVLTVESHRGDSFLVTLLDDFRLFLPCQETVGAFTAFAALLSKSFLDDVSGMGKSFCL